MPLTNSRNYLFLKKWFVMNPGICVSRNILKYVKLSNFYKNWIHSLGTVAFNKFQQSNFFGALYQSFFFTLVSSLSNHFYQQKWRMGWNFRQKHKHTLLLINWTDLEPRGWSIKTCWVHLIISYMQDFFFFFYFNCSFLFNIFNASLHREILVEKYLFYNLPPRNKMWWCRDCLKYHRSI